MKQKTIWCRVALGMLAGLAIGAVISEATYFFLRGGESRTPQVVVLTIPAGTAEKVDQGDAEPSLPVSMRFVVGDTLVVRNEDTATHRLGPLLIPPDASASLELNSAQGYAANCSFQPSQYLGIEVQPPLTLATRLLGILQAGVPLGFLLVLYGVFAVPHSGRAATT
jgi:hypothetical protein